MCLEVIAPYTRHTTALRSYFHVIVSYRRGKRWKVPLSLLLSVCQRGPPHHYLQGRAKLLSGLGNFHSRKVSSRSQIVFCVLTMNPSIYSYFISIITERDVYWFCALCTWIILTNLDNFDAIEEWLWPPSVPVRPISEYSKGLRKMRRMHETSILFLSFGALLFLVRQEENALSRLASLNSCSSVQGEPFWRCVRARSMSLLQRTRAMQHPRSIVSDGVNQQLDAHNLISASDSLLPDEMGRYLVSVTATYGSQTIDVNDRIRFNQSDNSYYVSVDDGELVFESIVSYLTWRFKLGQLF
jgi:hypothetical protein